MLDSIPHGAFAIVVGIAALTAREMLCVLSAWKNDASTLHQLKVESHTLRLRLKRQSAGRIYEEERHRAMFTSQSRAA